MELNIGIVGAGSFAWFAASAFIKVPGVRIVAVTDRDEELAKQMAVAFAATEYTDYEILLEDTGIDLVYIATPPFLHFQQSKMALLAGKHVVCEKPAALQVAEVEELIAIAGSFELLYVVNLMQRYNPLYGIVGKIIAKKMLGEFLHGFFENYASDENLNPTHWFWDEAKSGGIFVEHAVHFFDMFAGWLGEGKVIHSIALQRFHLDKKITDRVQATVLYPGGVVNFYHGFDQPKILDRQEMRLQFELGEITLYGWIPVKMKLHGLLRRTQLEELRQMLHSFSVDHQNGYQKGKTVKGRFNEISFDDHVTIDYGSMLDKQVRYEQMLMAMINDQWAWILDHKHKRIIDEQNALQSLRMAEMASRNAEIRTPA